MGSKTPGRMLLKGMLGWSGGGEGGEDGGAASAAAATAAALRGDATVGAPLAAACDAILIDCRLELRELAFRGALLQSWQEAVTAGLWPTAACIWLPALLPSQSCPRPRCPA